MKSLFLNRTYRSHVKSPDLVSFTVSVKETNLFISAGRNLEKEASDATVDARYLIEHYIESRKEFYDSLIPISEDRFAPPIIRRMIEDSKKAGVGPMACVAGAIAEFVSRRLFESKNHESDIIVENGGDVFLISSIERVISLYSENIPGGFGIEVSGDKDGIGISSSSAAYGHSLSLGACELATVIANSGSLSDASATALGNSVKRKSDIEGALSAILDIKDVLGALVVFDGKIGIKGKIKLVAIEG